MSFRRSRYIQAELLDDQPPLAAAPSLRDIVRINRILGGHGVLRGTLSRLVQRDERFTMLDVGAASGDAAHQVRKLYPAATIVSLDYREHHVHPAPHPRLLGDAFHLPFAPRAFDIVYCGLFLHHFEDSDVVALLRSFSRIARRYVVVNDLERHVLPYYFLPATTWLFRWHPITLHDGPISVQAAFTRRELHALAQQAGLCSIDVGLHRPAFRLSMVARPADDKLCV